MPPQPRPSVTYTALIGVGLVLVLLGAVLVALGLGGAAQFSAEAAGAKLSTTNSGLALAGIGAALAGIVAVKMPRHVRVFSDRSPPDLGTRLEPFAVPLLGIGLAALVLALALAWR